MVIMEQVLKASIVRPVGLWTEGERWEEVKGGKKSSIRRQKMTMTEKIAIDDNDSTIKLRLGNESG